MPKLPLQDSNLVYLIQSSRSGALLADTLHGSGDPTEHWRPDRLPKMPRSARRSARKTLAESSALTLLIMVQQSAAHTQGTDKEPAGLLNSCGFGFSASFGCHRVVCVPRPTWTAPDSAIIVAVCVWESQETAGATFNARTSAIASRGARAWTTAERRGRSIRSPAASARAATGATANANEYSAAKRPPGAQSYGGECPRLPLASVPQLSARSDASVATLCRSRSPRQSTPGGQTRWRSRRSQSRR